MPTLDQPASIPERVVIERLRLTGPTAGAQAGFPSPAEDHIETPIDLGQRLVPHPMTTFVMRVVGTSMEGADVHDGDIAVVDRSVAWRDGQVVVAAVGGGLTIKLLRRHGRFCSLWSVPREGPPTKLSGCEDAELWGVVRATITGHLSGGLDGG